jgi:hypothetical protein
VKRRLEHVEIPGEHEARERSWAVVRAAWEQREPAPRQRPLVRPALALAVLLAVAGAILSPPGRALVDEVREAIGVEKAAPQLFSLPATGDLLVSSDRGVWVVQRDGSTRLLGAYREASWSPFGRFVVAARPNELAALEPDGDLRWKLARRGVRLPRWGGTRTDTRIAYVSGTDLRIVAGDGTGDRRLARDVSPVAPAWRPGAAHVLAYARRDGVVRVTDVDSGTVLSGQRAAGAFRLEWVADRQLVVAPGGLRLHDGGGATRLRRRAPVAAALSPRAQELAVVRIAGGTSIVEVVSRRGATRRVFAGTGTFRDVTWSPDGNWLLVSWPEADQWVFVRVRGTREIRPVANVSEQFESEGFPVVEGWCCAVR